MKPKVAPAEMVSPARVEFQVQFSRGPKGRRRVRERGGATTPERDPTALPPATTQPTTSAPPAPRSHPSEDVPKVTRLLVLGHYFERLVRDGKVKNYAEIARLTGLSRARVTQIVNLTLLAPEIQEAILAHSSRVDDHEAGHDRASAGACHEARPESAATTVPR